MIESKNAILNIIIPVLNEEKRLQNGIQKAICFVCRTRYCDGKSSTRLVEKTITKTRNFVFTNFRVSTIIALASRGFSEVGYRATLAV